MAAIFVVIAGQMTSQPTLTARRQAAGLSLGEAAVALGVNRSTLLRWERGERRVPVEAPRLLERAIIARQRRPDQLVAAVRASEPLAVSEWNRRLDRDGRRDLRFLLESGKLVLAPGVRADGAGRRYVRQVVHVAKRLPVRGLRHSVPVEITGHQLGAARRFTGITVEQLAPRVGLAVSTVRDMEAAPTIPRGRVLELVDGLGLPAILDSARIRAVRKDAGWRLADIAGRVGVHVSVVHRWETAEIPVPVGRMLGLAAAMYEASALSTRAIAGRRDELLGAIIADVGRRPGITRQAVLHRRQQATVGRLGPRIDGRSVLTEAIRDKQIVETITTTVGPRGHRRTIRGLFLASDVPGRSGTKRLTGNDIADGRYRAAATRAELARAAGTTAASIAAWESHRERPIPLHWGVPIRAALGELEQRAAPAGTPDEQARRIIVELVTASPGISRYRLRRQAAKALAKTMGKTLGKEKAGIRALRGLIADRTIATAVTRLPRGPRYEGLFLAGSVPRAPAVSGAELRKLRVERGWTATDLGNAIGIPPGRLTAWERGVRPCPPDAAEKIRDALMQAPPLKPGRQLRRLLAAAAQPGGIASGALSASFFTASGRATLRHALDGGLVHIEERLKPRRDGRVYVCRFFVVGPGSESPAPAVEQMTGAELRQGRQAAGLSQVALGRLVGERNTRVWGWESGREPIPPGRVMQLRAALGMAGAPPS